MKALKARLDNKPVENNDDNDGDSLEAGEGVASNSGVDFDDFEDTAPDQNKPDEKTSHDEGEEEKTNNNDTDEDKEEKPNNKYKADDDEEKETNDCKDNVDKENEVNCENKPDIGRRFIIDEIVKRENWIMKKKANNTYGNQHAMIRRFNDEFDCPSDSQRRGCHSGDLRVLKST